MRQKLPITLKLFLVVSPSDSDFVAPQRALVADQRVYKKLSVFEAALAPPGGHAVSAVMEVDISFTLGSRASLSTNSIRNVYNGVFTLDLQSSSSERHDHVYATGLRIANLSSSAQ